MEKKTREIVLQLQFDGKTPKKRFQEKVRFFEKFVKLEFTI